MDEDEQDGAPDDDMMGQFPGGGGMPGMGDGGFGGLDFSKLGGGMGGMPDLGGEGQGDDSDDEEMPELEDEKGVSKDENSPPASGEGAADKPVKSSKIEEVE